MITAICNIYINSEEKLKLLKGTFPLVYEVSDNWLVYIRGKFKNEAFDFIRKIDSKKNNCTIFEKLYDNNWAKSTKKMLEKSRYDCIYIFLEDHFLMKSLDHFKDVLRDMIENKIEYLGYSFFNTGLSMRSAEGLYPNYSKHFYHFLLNPGKIKFLRKNNKYFYPFSLASVCTKEYFRKLLDIENKILIKVPFMLQVIMENIFFFYPKNRAFWFNINRLASILGIRFIIYPSATPFNLEKSLFDCDEKLLPIMVGGLKEELFVNFDDDNKSNTPSLIKRGLYPKRLQNNINIKPNLFDGKEYILNKGQSENHQYYPDVARIMTIPTKYVCVEKGILKISSSADSLVLNHGQSVWISANIPHIFFACEDCIFYVYLNSGLK